MLEFMYDVNALVQHKYAATNEVLFEVIEVQAMKCMGGVQVFYLCRPLHTLYEHEFSKKNFLGYDPGYAKDGGYIKFREDELKACSTELVELVKNPPAPKEEKAFADVAGDMLKNPTTEQQAATLKARIALLTKRLEELEGKSQEENK